MTTKPAHIEISYFVALIDNGVPKFSNSPVQHASRDDAQREIERLAAANPGQLFQAFQALVHKIVPGYVEPTFTGRELLTSAPAGVYKFRDGSSKGLIVVLLNGPVRVCLYRYSIGTVSPMHDRTWNDTEFEVTDQDPQKVLRGIA